MKNIIIFILAFYVMSCKSEHNRNVTLKFSKSIEIPLHIDIDLAHRGNTKYFKLDKINALASYSKIDHCIHIFDLDLLKEIKKINLSNLPNHKDVRAFTFINSETIFVTTQLRNQYYFVNTDGEVLKSFSILPKNFEKFDNVAYGNFNGGIHSIPIAHIENRFLVVNQSYFTIDPHLNKYRQLFFLEYKISDSIDISVVKIINQMDLVNKKGFIFSEPSANYCNVDNSLLANFYHDKNFIKIHLTDFKTTKIECKESLYYQKQGAFFDSTRWNESEYVTQYDYYSNGYNIIRYDPFNKLVYRVVSLKSPDSLNYITPYINIPNLKPFSVMIYDLDLKLLNEIKFPAKRYNGFNIVVTPKGILIGIENKDNPNFSTSKLQYDLFKVIKNE